MNSFSELVQNMQSKIMKFSVEGIFLGVILQAGHEPIPHLCPMLMMELNQTAPLETYNNKLTVKDRIPYLLSTAHICTMQGLNHQHLFIFSENRRPYSVQAKMPHTCWSSPSYLCSGNQVSSPRMSQGRSGEQPPSSTVEVKERVVVLYSPSGPSWHAIG